MHDNLHRTVPVMMRGAHGDAQPLAPRAFNEVCRLLFAAVESVLALRRTQAEPFEIAVAIIDKLIDLPGEAQTLFVTAGSAGDLLSFHLRSARAGY